jgi:DNA-binding Lrp family transcriptional regulator
VRELVSSIFDAAVTDGVTDAIRETVEAVPKVGDITQRELADALKQSKQTVSYRVGRARDGGWLVNNEQRRGHPAKIARGVPLPDANGASALPTVAEVLEESNRQILTGVDLPAPSPPTVATCPECGRSTAGCSFDPDFQEWMCSLWFDAEVPA